MQTDSEPLEPLFIREARSVAGVDYDYDDIGEWVAKQVNSFTRTLDLHRLSDDMREALTVRFLDNLIMVTPELFGADETSCDGQHEERIPDHIEQ